MLSNQKGKVCIAGLLSRIFIAVTVDGDDTVGILADDLSELGVTPSDLPKEICRQIAKARKEKHRDFN